MAKDTNTNQASQAEVRLPAGGPPACLPPARLPAGYPVLQLRSTPGDGCAAWQRDLQPHACCMDWDCGTTPGLLSRPCCCCRCRCSCTECVFVTGHCCFRLQLEAARQAAQASMASEPRAEWVDRFGSAPRKGSDILVQVGGRAGAVVAVNASCGRLAGGRAGREDLFSLCPVMDPQLDSQAASQQPRSFSDCALDLPASRPWSGRAWTPCLPTPAAPPWRSTRPSPAQTSCATSSAATSRWVRLWARGPAWVWLICWLRGQG